MHILPAAAFSLDCLADLYTRTFAGYFYPAVVTADDMARFVRVEDLDLAHSPVLCAGEEPVGLATVCLRGERANCRGFGVTLPHRGQGLAHPLCQAMLDYARRAGATSLRLGVLVQNEGAVRTYRQAGFRVTRRLLTWEWGRPGFPLLVGEGQGEGPGGDDLAQRPSPQPSPRGRGSAPSSRGVVGAVPDWLTEHFDRLHPVPPIWTRELTSLRRLDGLHCVAQGPEGRPTAYALVEPDGAGGSILDLAAETTEGARAVLALLQLGYQRLVCSNEPEDSPMSAALEAAGFAHTHQRYEMVIGL